MKRVALLSILIAAVLLSVAVVAEAQQPVKVWRIGRLTQGAPSSDAPNSEAFREGLRNLGYVEGKNIATE